MKIIITILSVCFALMIGNAQNKAWVLDTDFRACLKAIEPQAFDNNDSLIISNAATITKEITCNALKIKSIEGINHFSKVNTITLNGNELTSLEPLKDLPLTSLWCKNNQLTQLPNLGNFPNLRTLECDSNQLTHLPGLEKTKLKNINCSHNQIVELDSIVRLPIQWFLCTNNKITKLPDFTNFPEIAIFSASKNLLTEVKGLGNATKLKEIFLNDNAITQLPDLSKLVSLTRLLAGNNLLQEIPLGNNHPQLRELSVPQNKLTRIPDLKFYPALTGVSLKNNELLLVDLGSVILHPNYTEKKFSFYPQKPSLPTITSVVLENGNNYTMEVLTRDTMAQSVTFNWYKNGTLLQSSANANFDLKNISYLDTARYQCYIKGTLSSTKDISYLVADYQINMNSCNSILKDYDYSYSFVSCSQGYSLDLAPYEGGYPPYEYILTSTTTADQFVSSTHNIDYIHEHAYTLEITDDKGCILKVEEPIAFEKHPCNNTEFVFTPNNDGENDFFHIYEEGNAQIYNTTDGRAVSQLSTPANWYGTTSHGEILPDGYYVVIVNDATTYLVAIKK